MTAANAGVFRIHLAANSISLDARARHLFGIQTPDDPLPFHVWLECLHPEDRDNVVQGLSSTSPDRHLDMRFRVHRPSNSHSVIVDMKGSSLATTAQSTELIGLIWDATERAHRESAEIEALRESKEKQQKRAEKAEDLCTQKQELIDTVCHEIRNPLQGVVGATTLLRDDLARTKEELIKTAPEAAIAMSASGELCEDAAATPLFQSAFQHIETIEECARQQKFLADDVLDISRLAAGRMELHLQPTSLQQLFATLTTMFASAMQLRKLRVVTQIQHIRLRVDQQRLLQILVNLLSNAVKYTTPGGKITLSAWHTGGSLHMVVQDTGVGMDPETLATLFQRFSTVGSSNMGGSGLGLSITKRLIDAMSGKISYRSAKGQGTMATVVIPAEEVSNSEASKSGARLSPSRHRRLANPQHILIAEDNDVNRRILARFLEDLGCTHESATNGAEAVELFRRHPDKFDACMLDLRMPVLDGIEATKQIRTIHKQQLRYACGLRSISIGLIHCARPLRIIGVTGDVNPAQRASAFEAGMDDYVTKPYQRSTILEVLTCTSFSERS